MFIINCSTSVKGSDTSEEYSKLALSGKHRRACEINKLKVIIKTHGSESRGQAAVRDEQVSYFTQNLVGAVNKLP